MKFLILDPGKTCAYINICLMGHSDLMNYFYEVLIFRLFVYSEVLLYNTSLSYQAQISELHLWFLCYLGTDNFSILKCGHRHLLPSKRFLAK